METRTLRYFLAIAREENMTAAANILHVSQSALSRQMAELEASLGKQLFIRTNRQTLLTEDGMRLRQRAEEIIDLMEKTEMEMMSSSEEITGEVYIGAGETRAFELLSKAMYQTKKKYPAITFSVYSANALDVTEKLEHGSLDFGLLFEPVNKERYHYLDIPYDDIVGLLVNRADPLAEKGFITEEELTEIPILVSSRFSPDSVLSHVSKKTRNALKIQGSYNLIYNASLMVRQNLGAALAIDGLIPADKKDPFAFLPLRPETTMHTILVWKKYHLLSKASEAFLKELRAVIKEETEKASPSL